jgi:hypothetical protein
MEAVGEERRKRAEEDRSGRARALAALAARTAANMAVAVSLTMETH